jgi:hypothetical protein
MGQSRSGSENSMRRHLATGIIFAVITTLALGCGGGGGGGSSSPTEPARRDTIVLLSVDPPEGTRVRLGGKVQVLARFRYAFAQPTGGGQIGVLVYPLPFGLPLLTNPLVAQANVEGQQGEATLRFSILLNDPDQQLRPGPITADFALFAQGQRESTTQVQVRYEVVP